MFRYRAIFFDAGDTLIARKPDFYSIIIDRFAKVGIKVEPATAKDAWRRARIWAGEQSLREAEGAPRMPDDEFFEEMENVALRSAIGDRNGNEIAALISKFREYPKANQSWELIEGALETLEYVRRGNYKVGLVSNFGPDLPEILDQLRLSAYFDTVVVSAIAGVEKPNPKILEMACNNVGVEPKYSLYVGDHMLDILCAKEARMDIAWICKDDEELPSGFAYKPDYTIASIKDVMAVLSQ